MKTQYLFTVLGLTMLGIFLFPSTATAACVQITDQEKFDRAELVGLGEIRVLQSNGVPLFKMTKIYKAEESPPYNSFYIFNGSTVDTPEDVPWKTNQSYLMYLHTVPTDGDNTAYFYTTTCDGTREYSGMFTASETAVLQPDSRNIALPIEPGSDLPKPQPVNQGMATTFSIEVFEGPSYESPDYGPYDLLLSRMTLTLLIVAWLLLTIAILRPTGATHEFQVHWKWILAGVAVLCMAVNMLLFGFQPKNWKIVKVNQPTYTLFTPAAEATLGCADLRATIFSIATPIINIGLVAVIMLTLFCILSPSFANRFPALLKVLFVSLIILEILPFWSLMAQSRFVPGC